MTEKQRRFADHYMATSNATEAARQAGYNAAVDHTYEQIGFENLRKPEIRNYIEERLQPEREKRSMTADEIVAAFCRIAAGEELPNGKIPTADNMLTALDKLSRIRGMYIDKSQIEMTNAVPVVINDDVSGRVDADDDDQCSDDQ